MSWLAMPTPITEPMRVCELEAGRPNHQVPRFQMMAATSRAKTMANPALLPTCKNQFDGQQRDDGEGYQAAGGEHAEEVPEAGPNHGDVGLQRVGVDDGGHGVGGVVESVDELEAERDQQRDAQQDRRAGPIGYARTKDRGAGCEPA